MSRQLRLRRSETAAIHQSVFGYLMSIVANEYHIRKCDQLQEKLALLKQSAGKTHQVRTVSHIS